MFVLGLQDTQLIRTMDSLDTGGEVLQQRVLLVSPDCLRVC